MPNIEKIEVNGKGYYYNGSQFFDECFLLVEGLELQQVAAHYYGNHDYQKMTPNELYDFAKHLKIYELYVKAKEVMEYGLDKFEDDDNFLYKMLPIYTSCCRKLYCPEEAVRRAESYLPFLDFSEFLCTSLAAACCDMKNYDRAKRYARMAYAKQGGGQGYKTELSLVFLRIKKETGEDFF